MVDKYSNTKSSQQYIYKTYEQVLHPYSYCSLTNNETERRQQKWRTYSSYKHSKQNLSDNEKLGHQHVEG
eukprot:5624117-Heterocapsa_arctica.AAC.1